MQLAKTVIQKIDTLVIPDVLFATNSYVLTARALVLLDNMMADTRFHLVDSIVIEGHTDSKGAIPLNEKLSQNRAASVASYLSQTGSANKPSLQTRGWAAQRLRSSNSTPGGRQKNRRVEIFIYKQD